MRAHWTAVASQLPNLFRCTRGRCARRRWGCRCGDTGRKKREKEAKRQEDIAQQREEKQNIKNQFLSQLTPGSQEFNQLQALDVEGLSHEQVRQQGTQVVSQHQARIAAGGPATALEARTNLSVEGLRQAAAFTPEEQDILRVQRGEPPTTPVGRQLLQRLFVGGDGADLSAEFARALRGQPTTTPLGAQATRMVGLAGEEPDTAFTQELALLQDRINREANARGLATSGIPIEQLGRAGVELAVRKATERENIRRTREADVLDLFERARQGDQTDLSNLNALFTTGQRLRGREIGVEEAVTNLQAGRESKLTDLLQSQTGTATQNLLELLSTQTGRAENIRDLASALREAERQRTEQLVGQLGTTAAATGLSLIPGVGPFLDAGTLGAGQGVFGGRQDPFSRVGLTPSATLRGRPVGIDVGSLLAAQQAPQAGTGTSFPSVGLNRRRKEEDEFADLVRALQASGGDFAAGLRGAGR